jgi:hypothetical protein
VESVGAFAGAWAVEQYLFLVPFHYPAIVRYDTVQDRVDYLEGCHDIFVQNVQGEWHAGGSCIWKEFLILASPTDNRVIGVHIHTLEVQHMVTGAKNGGGCMNIVPEGEELWMLPYGRTTVTRWNPVTGEVREYSDMPKEFYCINRPHMHPCMERPFGMVAFTGKLAILSPFWGNMFVCLNTETGETSEWIPPFPVRKEEKNGYYMKMMTVSFLRKTEHQKKDVYRVFSHADSNLYEINLRTMEYHSIPITYNRAELLEHANGFGEDSEWLQYAAVENSFNSLGDFLDGTMKGEKQNREAQLRAYRKIAANNDGTCGEKVHRFACERIRTKGEEV